MFRRRAAPLYPLLLALLLPLASGAAAQGDGHGPDAWQVAGVAQGDVLNVRMGPGTDYPVIGGFSPDARGLRMETCVPLMSLAQHMALTPAERNALPPRWCLMRDPATESRGWVSAAYLAEDAAPAPAEGSDDPVAASVALVRQLYQHHLAARRGAAADPLNPSRARNFFFSDGAQALSSGAVQAHPLFGTQDAEITDLEIRPDPETPMLRGMVTVRAYFRNFGQPQTAAIRLRADTTLPGAPFRIMRIEHAGGSFP